MGAASILIVHPDRKIQRTVHRILGGTGHGVDVADDVGQAVRLLSNLAPILVVVDGSAMASPSIEPFLAAAKVRGAEACIMLVGATQLEQAPRILSLGAVTNLLVHPMPVLGEELTITAQKLIRDDLFGAEKYLLWGTELHAATLTRASQRVQLVGELAEQLRGHGQSARVASIAMLVADELISNAVHNAPVDDRGTHYRADLARDAELALDGRHAVVVRWGCDGRYVAIESLKKAHTGASKQLAIWKDSPSVKEWRVYDNTGTSPELVAHGGGGVTEIADPAKFDAILAKGSEGTGSASTVAAKSVATVPAAPSVATLVPGATAATVSDVSAYQGGVLDVWASDHGLTPSEYRSRVDGLLARESAKSSIEIRAGAAVLDGILDDGRFKSQFETNTSAGTLNQNYRANAEAKMFGYPIGLDPAKRPIYGYLSGSADPIDGDINAYGEVAIRLKADVAARSTVTFADSLGEGTRGEILPQPLTSPTSLAKPFNEYVLDPLSITNPTLEDLSEGYAEVQIHGGVSVSDIESVTFRQRDLDYYEKTAQRDVDLFAARLAAAEESEPGWSPATDQYREMLARAERQLASFANRAAALRRRLTDAGIRVVIEKG